MINLEWVSHKENTRHQLEDLRRRPANLGRRGRQMYWKSKPFTATCVKSGKEISFACFREAEIKGFNRYKISLCLKGKHKTGNYEGFIWRYENA